MPFASKEDRRQYSKKYYEANKARGWNKHLAYETPERKEEKKIAMREYALKRNYGITIEEYEKMLFSQDGKCSLCGEEPKTKDHRYGKARSLAVDHCHKSGKVRRLLCTKCNLGLGWYETNKDRIDKYLQEN
jgi:hypothetical protein